MVFDVMVRKGALNGEGKQVFEVFRCSDAELSKRLRQVQNDGDYIFSVIPLFKKRNEQSKQLDIF
jgi:hypothetical protein